MRNLSEYFFLSKNQKKWPKLQSTCPEGQSDQTLLWNENSKKVNQIKKFENFGLKFRQGFQGNIHQ